MRLIDELDEIAWFLNSLQKGREGSGGGRDEIMLLYRVSWRGWSGTFSQVRLKLNFKPRLKYWKKNFETIEICQAYHHWRKTYSFVNIDLQYRTTAKLVFHQILAVFFRIMANCIHLVFYRFLHFFWHFVELFLLSGVISANPILEDKISYEEPKNVSNLSTPSSFEKNIVIRKYWSPIEITFFWQTRVWTARNT